MTNDQVMGLVRQALQLAGGVITGVGWLTQGQVDEVTQNALQAIGPVMNLLAFYWAWKANSKHSILASVANMLIVRRVRAGLRAIRG